MKTYQASEIRNFAIVGHASSGKTMLSEAMLACGGVTNRLGTIASGNTVSDYHDSEKQRQISIHASLLHTEWQERKFNVIDTPGYLDFISEGLGALRVGDFALIATHAETGVQVGTDKVWDYATQFGIPKMFVINALDKENADFDTVLQQIRDRYSPRVFPMTVPLNAGPGFNELLDVMRSEVVTYKTDTSGKFEESPASGEHKERVDQLHEQLIEYIAESDDSLMEKFFDQGGLSEEELRAGIHAAVQNQTLIPLFATSAETNVGVARLMDFIAKFGSSPVDRKKVGGMDQNDNETEVSLDDPNPVIYVFKTLNEEHVGELSFFRVYAGAVKPGMELYNSGRSTYEKVGQIFIMNGKDRASAETLGAGDIGVAVKMKHTHTGDTLCGPKSIVSLPRVEYPKPNIHAALHLNSKGDEDKIAQGLSTLHEEDPTFLYNVDSELHQTVISAQGELHLDVIAQRLKNRYKVDFDLIQPKIPYRETIKAKSDAKYRHKKQSGGAGQFAEVWLRVEPKQRGEGVEFTQSLVGQNVDRGFVPSVERGVNDACKEGIVAGYRVVDLKVDFYDGKMHPVDSKDIAFQIAGKQCFRDAFMNAKPCLLEPICEVKIQVPSDAMGNVMGDLSSRRGKILGMDSEGAYEVVKAQVPQRELYRYSSTLRSLTGGRGIHTEEFSHYEEMPRDLEQKVIAESKRDGDE